MHDQPRNAERHKCRHGGQRPELHGARRFAKAHAGGGGLPPITAIAFRPAKAEINQRRDDTGAEPEARIADTANPASEGDEGYDAGDDRRPIRHPVV